MSLTRRQREGEVFALVREVGEWKEIRNAADRRLRALRAQVEALAHPPRRKGRAALAVRLCEYAGACVAPSAHERKGEMGPARDWSIWIAGLEAEYNAAVVSGDAAKAAAWAEQLAIARRMAAEALGGGAHE